MRQIVLDTETTGLEVEQQHRIIEIGCVELLNRRLTGRVFHRYLNPERDIDAGAQEVHGITREQLRQEPKFAEIAPELLEAAPSVASLCRVLDTLPLARQMHPGQRNNLDALCKRYSVDNSHREYHGALLDARILAEVYLAMTGGQANLTLGVQSDPGAGGSRAGPQRAAPRSGARRIPVIAANDAELGEHTRVLGLLDKASGGKTVWRRS
jgi:DNA polymerase-3 subunit epsilon